MLPAFKASLGSTLLVVHLQILKKAVYLKVVTLEMKKCLHRQVHMI